RPESSGAVEGSVFDDPTSIEHLPANSLNELGQPLRAWSLRRGQLPNPSGPIQRSGKHRPSIWAKLSAENGIGVEQAPTECLSAFDVPQAGLPILGGSDDPLAVRTKARRPEAQSVFARASQRLTGLCVPNSGGAVT